MSSEVAVDPQDPVHIAIVDVDESAKGEGSQCEPTTDSGLETKSSELEESVLPSESAILPNEPRQDDEQRDTKVVSKEVTETGTPSSLSYSSDSSPGGNTFDIVSNFDEFSTSQCDRATLNNSNEDFIALTETRLESPQNMDSTDIKTVPPDTSTSTINDSKHFVDKHQTYLDTNKSLATSTVSLNDTTDTNVTICKSPYSRSAENISVDVKTEQSPVDTDAILSQFKSQKNKVSATQVIAPETHTHANLDVRYTRLPKELLSQDLGSIVKNVHGIFSSVSGSLKSAYTHRAGQIPYMKTGKVMPNGKLMNDIFEDEQNDETMNGIEKQKTELISKDAIESVNQNLNVEEGDAKGDVLRLHIETLERVLAEQRKENSALRERVKQQADELQNRDQTFKEMETKMDLMSKRVESAERSKDAAVMRYAGVERGAIEARRAAAAAARAERAAAAEAELLAGKLRAARDDKQRICQLYDDKCHELQNTERELAKVREDRKELEGRLKWTQSKLRMEMDAYKDSAERVEKLTARAAELEAARDAAAAGAEDASRAKQLETELKENQAALILCRHERDSLEARLRQLDAARQERDAAAAARDAARAEVKRLQEQNLRLEEEAAELAALRAQAALADTLSAQLARETERAAAAEEALGRERARAETCARREAAALEHAARLTAQHVSARAHSQHADHQAQALSADNVSLRERVAALERAEAALRAARADEAERRHRESRVLARKVAELQEELAAASRALEWQQGENSVLKKKHASAVKVAELQEELAAASRALEWQQGENSVLKKKHASAVKELNRELARALKRVEQLEAKQPPTQPSTRTGSVTSLSSGESAPPDHRLSGHDALPDIQVREPDRQALVERIVSLQRAAARRAERCEFLEEHARQLTDELRNKSRLLRHLLPTLPAQALSSTASDSNKKEIAKFGGGAMAALWGGDPGGLSLELAIEMNKRLQSVLEDTLLKNITLKENMDTLGEEIARLKGDKNPNDK